MTYEFREAEVYEYIVNGITKTAVMVGGRLRVYHETGLAAGITTTLLESAPDGSAYRVQATVSLAWPGGTDRQGARVFVGTSTADARTDPKLRDSLLELAETRAIARALRFAGFGVEFVGSEELSRDSGPPAKPADYPPKSSGKNDERRPPATNGGSKPAASPPPAKPARKAFQPQLLEAMATWGRAECAKFIQDTCAGELGAMRAMLKSLLPGATTVAGLEHEASVHMLSTGLAVLYLHEMRPDLAEGWCKALLGGNVRWPEVVQDEGFRGAIWSALRDPARRENPKAEPVRTVDEIPF